MEPDSTEAAEEALARPNLAAVAALAGVSASTASLAFSGAGPVAEATRAKVLAAAEQLNYAGPDPRARSLRRGRSGIIGVVIEDHLRDAFRDPMNIAMLDGVADETGAAGFALLLLHEGADTKTGVSDAPMDAAVLVGCSTRMDDSVHALRQRGIPMVAIEAASMDGVLAVDLDNREATRRGAEHLRELGHERVGIVLLPLEPQRAPGPLTAERLAGSSAFTATERLAGAREVFPDAPGYIAAGSFIDAGAQAARWLLERSDPPTAIIAQSDMLAIGVVRAAEELGLRVPDDLSVLGFDGARVDGVAPAMLTTLVQPAIEKGQAAGRMIVRALDGEHPESVTLHSRLRIGSTTAAPPRAD